MCFIPAVQATEPFTAHQLRHSYATMLYDADVDVKTAQKLLGHADFSVTMKIYTHLSAEKESTGIEKLNQHVTKCLGDSIRNKVKEQISQAERQRIGQPMRCFFYLSPR